MLTEYDLIGPDHPSASALVNAIYKAKAELTKQTKTGKISAPEAVELQRRYWDFNNALYHHRKWGGEE
jgi:hypothetical protein